MTTYIFICPFCGSDDIMPRPGSRECGDCGEQFVESEYKEKDD